LKKTPLEQQERRYDERRKTLKRLLGFILFITFAVIVLGLWRSLRRRNTVVNAPAALPQNVSSQLSGYTFTRSEEGRQIFTIHAARTLSYGKGSRMALEDVHVIIYGPEGNRHDEIATNRCWYDSKTSALQCSGNASVKLESQAGMRVRPDIQGRQPLFIETSDISFDPEQSTAGTGQSVRFQFGPASGTARGITYNTRSGNLALEKDVTLDLPGRPGGAGTVKAMAGGLTYRKQANQVALSSPVHIEQGGRSVTASAGEIFLDSANRITRVTLSEVQGADSMPARELKGSAENFAAVFDPATGTIRRLLATGHVMIEDWQESAGNGSRRQLAANRVSLDLAGAKSEPQRGEAQGNVRLVYVPSKGGAGTLPASQMTRGPAAGERILSASDLLLAFQPGGLLKEAHTEGPGKLELIPTDPSHDRQTVTAGKFQMAFDSEGRLQAIHGSSSTQIVDEPPARADRARTPMTSSANELLAQLDTATGALETIQQRGDFRFQQGDNHAKADEAKMRKQDLTLSGSPEVWDPDGRIRARHILFDTAAGIAKGWDEVQSVYFGQPRAKGTSSSQSQDTNSIVVLADRVTAYKEQQYAHYEGNVRAWSGPDVVQSPSLDLYRKQQRLSSGKGVVTSLVEPALSVGNQSGNPKTPKGAVQPVTISADRLEYFNLRREAVYVGNVHMISADSTFVCDRLEVYFSEPGGTKEPEIEKAIATGNVRLAQPPDRHAQAERADYFAAAGKIILTGGPPVIYDEQQGYLTGQRLTFFIRDASLFLHQ
jgi:lipopolysaccharide export system protein LptA